MAAAPDGQAWRVGGRLFAWCWRERIDPKRSRLVNRDVIAVRVRDEAEKSAVLRVLSRVNGNMSRAANLLGVSRPTLYDLLNRFGLKETVR